MTLRSTDLRTRTWLGGLAFGGAAAAHILAYVITIPDPHHREAILEATGHGYWVVVIPLAMAALVASLCGLVLSPRGQGSVADLFRRTATSLALLQVVGFVAIEAIERAVMGTGPWDVLQEPAVLIGIALQALVAMVGAGLLVAFRTVIGRFRAAKRKSGAGSWSRPEWLDTQHLSPPASPVAGGVGSRGPPSL